MFRPHRQRAILIPWLGFASGVALLWAVGCSDSGNGGTTIPGACDPATDDSCAELGGACESNDQCSTAACSGGLCVTSLDCEGAGCMSVDGGEGLDDTFFVDDFDPPTNDPPAETCVDLDVDFQRVTPTVMMLVDQSGSMGQPFDTVVVNGQPESRDRWDALEATLTDPQSSLVKKLETSVRFGMALYTSFGGFGNDGGNECPVLENVSIGLGSFGDISRTLRNNGPRGDTPTAESVEAVAAQLVDFDEDGPKSIILATDGDPDTCEDPDSNDSPVSKALSVAAVEAAYANGITTHVISVGDDVTANHLKDLAVAGAGGDDAAEAYTALDTQALVAAFNEIIGSVRTCDFTLEGTVEADDASRGSVLLDGSALSFGDPNGWEMPDEQTVRLLGAACEQVQADATGISMTFPCDAIQIIPR